MVRHIAIIGLEFKFTTYIALLACYHGIIVVVLFCTEICILSVIRL